MDKQTSRYVVGGVVVAGIAGAGVWYFLLGGKDWVGGLFAGGPGETPAGTTYKVVVGSQAGDTITLAGNSSHAPQGISCFSAPPGEYDVTATDQAGRTYFQGTVQVVGDTKVNILVLPGQQPQVSVFSIPPGEFTPFKPFCGE